MQIIKIAKVTVLIVSLVVVSYISSCRKEQQVILSLYNGQYTAQIFWNGNFLSGYSTILKVKDDYSKQIFKKPLYLYYDAYGDWKKYLKEMKWKDSNILYVEFHESLFAFNKELILIDKNKKSLDIDGLKVNFIFPTQSSITSYERRKTAGKTGSETM